MIWIHWKEEYEMTLRLSVEKYDVFEALTRLSSGKQLDSCRDLVKSYELNLRVFVISLWQKSSFTLVNKQVIIVKSYIVFL